LTVGGISNRFLHDRGVDDELVEALFFDDFTSTGCFNALGESFFHPFFAKTLPPSRERGRIRRRFMLKVSFSAKLLPIGILYSGSDDFFIGTAKRMLQVEQTRYPAGRYRRTPCLRWKERGPTRFEYRPIDQFG
jgi:hypothetical protein